MSNFFGDRLPLPEAAREEFDAWELTLEPDPTAAEKYRSEQSMLAECHKRLPHLTSVEPNASVHTMDLGDVSFHHIDTLHSSTRNEDRDLREAYGVIFMATSPVADDPTLSCPGAPNGESFSEE